MSRSGRKNNFISCVGLAAGLVCSMVHADECIRSTPSPIFATDRDEIRVHSFSLKSDHEAVEQFRLRSGMQVEVVHGGCEYLVTTFKFKSAELFATTYSVALAYKTAASLLQKLKDLHPQSGFDLDKASATLLKEVEQKQNPELDEELTVDGDGVPPLEAGIKIDSAGRQGSSGYLELTMFRGPL